MELQCGIDFKGEFTLRELTSNGFHCIKEDCHKANIHYTITSNCAEKLEHVFCVAFD